MIAFTLEQLLELHELVLAETGGSPGLRELGRLESVIAAQTQHVFGQELHETLFEKSAAVICGIIADHPFVDGNKRTAILSGLTFLRVNGKVFKAKKGELENFAVMIATDHLSIAEIASWLEKHCN